MDDNTTLQQRPRFSRRGFIGGAAALIMTGGGTAAWALDRFVVEHAEVTDASALWSSTTTSSSSSSGTVNGTTWSSDAGTISITAHTSGSGSSASAWYVADLQLADASYLRTAFAKDTYGENIIEYPSVMASDNNAIWALNGDYYGFRDTGIVVRNGVAFRDAGARQGLALFSDGRLALYDETTTTAAVLVSQGVWQTWSFGPGLVDDGRALSGLDSVEVDTNPGNHSIQGNQPRTGFGMIEPNHFVGIAFDGRSSGYSKGVSLTAFADLFVDLGAQVAYNLDGGGSTDMVFNDALVNKPLGTGKERGTSDILYVAR